MVPMPTRSSHVGRFSDSNSMSLSSFPWKTSPRTSRRSRAHRILASGSSQSSGHFLCGSQMLNFRFF